MKRKGNFLLGILGILYIMVVVIVVALLLGYNKYGVTELFDYVIFNVEGKTLEPFKEGDLLFVKKLHSREIEEGDKIFFYEVNNDETIIHLKEVNSIYSINGNEKIFIVDDNQNISSQNLIGKTEYARVYGSLGGILSILESRQGFIIFIILPFVLLFIYKMSRIFIESKETSEKSSRKYNEDNNRYASAENNFNYSIKKQKPLKLQKENENKVEKQSPLIESNYNQTPVKAVKPVEIKNLLKK